MAKLNYLFPGREKKSRGNTGTRGYFITRDNDTFYKIENVQGMDEFFMTLVSDADHWMFISSLGALTAGRINRDYALFPYDTVDRIYAYRNRTGVKTAIRVEKKGATYVWEPWTTLSARTYDLSGNLYKNITGCEIIFEEINASLDLGFSYSWSFSRKYGFIKKSRITNMTPHPVSLHIADGLSNMICPGITHQLLTTFSCLTDAYKYNVLHPSGLAAYNLASQITDKAEPKESLRATVCWNAGLEEKKVYLSIKDYLSFCVGIETDPVDILKGQQNDYFITTSFTLLPQQTKEWYIVADVNKSQVDTENLIDMDITSRDIIRHIETETQKTKDNLRYIIARADGLQLTGDRRFSAHHFGNTLFNSMRGGIIHGTTVNKRDFLLFLETKNTIIHKHFEKKIDLLLPEIKREELLKIAGEERDPSLYRLLLEYLPLRFSRRHGDPTRPWNTFSIIIDDEKGRPVLQYQGNWRDIFQNWEALGLSFPGFYKNFIAKFLNATTPDGYNPYRVTRDGFEWERVEPGNPWSNIGYWKDHQIIYLQKLCEWEEHFFQGALIRDMTKEVYSYAHIPYRIREYEKMLDNPGVTIDFDDSLDTVLQQRIKTMGTDGALLCDKAGNIYHVSLLEKLLILFLAKMSSFVPDGGIWLNTQRPEWNDANNALAGYGLSMVTLYYVRRFIYFWLHLWEKTTLSEISLSEEIISYADDILGILDEFKIHRERGFTDDSRKAFMDASGKAATTYHKAIYSQGGFSGKGTYPFGKILTLFRLASEYVDISIEHNRRSDGLYHSYNLLHFNSKKTGVAIHNLYVMLEGQVAVLSSGALTPAQSASVYRHLAASPLFRKDRNSFLLYPDKELPHFFQKNRPDEQSIRESSLLSHMLAHKDYRIIEESAKGTLHFQADITNVTDLAQRLDKLEKENEYTHLVSEQRNSVIELYMNTFHHREFTGRSGGMFAYEGLGSIYWHMTAKLLLALQENYKKAVQNNENPGIINELKHGYIQVRNGIGYLKDPLTYGAFPMDPYSHTPAHSGARQPGMTGQVKEEIITRFGELGISVRDGCLYFHPNLITPGEWLKETELFHYFDVRGNKKTLEIKKNQLAFTLCQVPVIYERTKTEFLRIHFTNNKQTECDGCIDPGTTQSIIMRRGSVELIYAGVSMDDEYTE